MIEQLIESRSQIHVSDSLTMHARLASEERFSCMLGLGLGLVHAALALST